MINKSKKSTRATNKRNVKKEIEEDLIYQDVIKQKNIGRVDINNIKAHFKCKTENQKIFVNLIKNHIVCAVYGVAGSGKTFIACATALQLLLDKESSYNKIILVKSVTDLKGESIGYLKGTLEDKLSPYLESFKDNFNKLIGDDASEYLFANKFIRIEPLAFIRGRTFDNAIIIIDETQNITYDAARSILTRLGDNSKIVLLGDTKQIDLNNKKESSYLSIINKFKNNSNFGIIEFTKEDQVRHWLINEIEDIFDEIENEKNEKNKKI